MASCEDCGLRPTVLYTPNFRGVCSSCAEKRMKQMARDIGEQEAKLSQLRKQNNHLRTLWQEAADVSMDLGRAVARQRRQWIRPTMSFAMGWVTSIMFCSVMGLLVVLGVLCFTKTLHIAWVALLFIGTQAVLPVIIMSIVNGANRCRSKRRSPKSN